MRSAGDPPVVLRGLDVRFKGVHAVNQVSVELPPGITGIIGPNGAGKTTLFNAVTGYVTLTAGTVEILGEQVKNFDPVALRKHGISRTFQHLELFAEMTVIENVITGLHSTLHSGILRAVLRTPGQRKEERLARERAEALCAQFGLLGVLDEVVGSLAYGTQKLVALARALAGEPRVLLLDEPASGLTESEGLRVIEYLQAAVAGRDLDIILVEHNMRFVAAVAEWVVALNMGRVIAQGTPDDVLNDQGVIDAYLGGSRV